MDVNKSLLLVAMYCSASRIYICFDLCLLRHKLVCKLGGLSTLDVLELALHFITSCISILPPSKVALQPVSCVYQV